MSKVRIYGDVSGYVDIAVPDNAGTTTLNLDKIPQADINGNIAMDTNTLYVDAANNRVGVGTASPNTTLDIVSPSSAEAINIRGRSADDIGQLKFYENDGTTSLARLDSRTTHFEVGSYNELRFSAGGVGNSHVVIDTSGRVGIGATTPNYDLQISRTATSVSDDPTFEVKNTWSGQGNNVGFRNKAIGLFSAGNGTVITRVQSRYDTGANVGSIGTQTSHDFLLTTGDTERMRIDSSGNVGINASNPDFKFNVVGSTNYETVKLYYTETANVTQRLGIAGRNYENTNNIGIIAMYDDGNNCVINVGGGFNAPDNIEFRTGSSSAVRMNIDPSGNLIVGNAGASFTSDRLQVESPSNEPVASFYRPRNTAGGGLVRFMSDVGGTQTIVAQVTSEGNFITNGGINFGGSVNSGGTVSSSNTLDDYEEGTWTPVTSSGTMSGGSGSYIKIGAFVTLIYRWSSISGGSGQVSISGLPFTRSTSIGNLSPASGNCMWDGINTTRGITPYLGGNNMTFYGNGSGNSDSWWYLQHSNANGSTQPLEVYGSIWYYTDQ